MIMVFLNATFMVAWIVVLLFTITNSMSEIDAHLQYAKDAVVEIEKNKSIFAERASNTVSRMDTTVVEVESSTNEEVIEAESSQSIPEDEVEVGYEGEAGGYSSKTVDKEQASPLKVGEDYTDISLQTKEVEDGGISQDEWADKVCGDIKDTVCHEVFIVKSKQATFCSAAKVASTTTKQYFYDISDGEMTIPEGARFGVHEANWKKFGKLSHEARKWVLENEDWTHVFFWKHVLERFVSGYLDKVVYDCKKDPTDKPHLAIHHYLQYGFSCEEHEDLEAFVTFMETVPKFEGHFAPQTPLCNVDRFPYTDIVRVDENLSERLKNISFKLGVEHPEENIKTTKHKTEAKEKMVAIFKDRPHLIKKILNMFKEDCERIPQSCDVEEIMAAIEEGE